MRQEIANLEKRKRETVQQLVDGSIGTETVGAVIAEFDSRIRVLQSQQVDQVMAETFDAVVFDLDQIDSMPINEQRASVQMYIKRLTVLPAKRLGRGFDPTSVEIVWRDLSRLRWHAVVEAS